MYQESKPPEVWGKLGRFMHQDYYICYPDCWSGIEEFWQGISGSERKELVLFLQHVNGPDLPGGMQKKYWQLSGAQIMPSKLKPFLNTLLTKFESLQNV